MSGVRGRGRESSSRLPAECGAQEETKSQDPWDNLSQNQESYSQSGEPLWRPKANLLE